MRTPSLAVIVLAALAIAPAAGAKPHGDLPPGLAKKPYGLPPGQAKKLWRRGERLPPAYFAEPRYYVEPVRYRLAPPPPGYRWVLVDGNAYLVQTRTGLIADLVADLLR